MHRIVLLMAVLTRAVAPQTSAIVPSTEPSISTTMPPPPTVFRNPRPMTGKPRRPRPGKVDSPMLNYIFDSYATSNKHFHDKFKPPSFEDGKPSDDTIINADTGATVIFDCRVTSLRDKTKWDACPRTSAPAEQSHAENEVKVPVNRGVSDDVFSEIRTYRPGFQFIRKCSNKVSWIRVSEDENLELLTVDLETHTADARYRVDIAGENWKLALSDAKIHDSGIYCCHVSTHPPMLKRFKLIVHAPEIRMSKEAFLESGETLSLKCAVLNLHPGEVEPELRWYKGNTTTPLEDVRGGVLVETDHLTLTSQLQVARLKVEDAGNYTCALEAPLQMRAIARVHVLQGSSLAELQSGVKTTTSYRSLLLTSMVLLYSIHGDVR